MPVARVRAFTLERDYSATKEWAILCEGREAVPGVRFATEYEARIVMDALQNAESHPDASPPTKKASDRPARVRLA
jgi:hypothetical protein